MIKMLAIALACCTLGGCLTLQEPQPQIIVQTKYKVVQIPDELYRCPQIKDWPNPSTLTDQQVGKLLVQLQSNNLNCAASLAAIKAYMKTANRIIR